MSNRALFRAIPINNKARFLARSAAQRRSG
jgi:hypothetical protein